MNVLILTLFVSFALVALLLLGFVAAMKRGEIDHADRLSLLPFDDDDTAVISPLPLAHEPRQHDAALAPLPTETHR